MKKRIVFLIRRFTWLDWTLVVIFVMSCIYLIIFSWTRLRERNVPVEYLAEGGGKVAGSESQAKIYVDVAGAVAKPGVYQLSSEGRIKDALVAAGGLTDEADRTHVEKVMNLAMKIKDGDKVYIPFKVDALEGVAKETHNSLININTATVSELDGLWGVGAVRANEIVANRPYSSIEDILTKKIVTKAIFEKIKGQIAVY